MAQTVSGAIVEFGVRLTLVWITATVLWILFRIVRRDPWSTYGGPGNLIRTISTLPLQFMMLDFGLRLVLKAGITTHPAYAPVFAVAMARWFLIYTDPDRNFETAPPFRSWETIAATALIALANGGIVWLLDFYPL
jgi:hypothetical protein